MNLVNIQSAHSTIFESTLVLTLRVTNETNQPLQLQGTSHSLKLNGNMVGRGVSDTVTVVPPLGSTVFPVTIRMDNLKLLNQFGDGRLPPALAYRLESRLFTQPGQQRGLAVLTEGSLDLRPYQNGLKLN